MLYSLGSIQKILILTTFVHQG